MRTDSAFLGKLVGKAVRIIAVDEEDLPPLVLREVSRLGVVADSVTGSHFFPWNEVVEIRPCDDPRCVDVEAMLGLDSEP